MSAEISVSENTFDFPPIFPSSTREDSPAAQRPTAGSSDGHTIEIIAPSPLRSALKNSTSVASLKLDSPFRSIKWTDQSDTITPPSSDEIESDTVEKKPSKEKNLIIQNFIDRHFAAKRNKELCYEKVIENIHAGNDDAGRAWNSAAVAVDEEISITREASLYLIKANKKLKEQASAASSVADLDSAPPEKGLKASSPTTYVFSSAADAAHAMTVARVRVAEATEQNAPDLSELSAKSEQIDNVAYHWLDTARSMREMIKFTKEAKKATQDEDPALATSLTQKANTAQQRAKLLTHAAIAFEKGDETKAAALKDRAKNLP